jgi:hypothetical protein
MYFSAKHLIDPVDNDYLHFYEPNGKIRYLETTNKTDGTKKRVIDPTFSDRNTDYTFVDSFNANVYKEIEESLISDYNSYLKMFKFDLITYDEIEDFTYPYSSPLFNYPFKNQKNNINHYEFDHDTETLF